MKTAVEFYAEQEVKLTLDFLANKINQVEYGIKRVKLIEQAKEMEKQQKGYSEEEVKTMLYNCVDVLEYNTKGLWNKDGLVNEIIETFKSE